MPGKKRLSLREEDDPRDAGEELPLPGRGEEERGVAGLTEATV
ncbi:MAG TPA: hypothetical protein VGV35_12445 [Bryobacteraceae bacterium]|nr:hypothetical protein [Bryobacteraceae bacterium]